MGFHIKYKVRITTQGGLKLTRQEVFYWVKGQYGTDPEYPWKDQNAVLRNKNNNKWYAVILKVSRNKLGLTGESMMDIINVKSDPILIGAFRMQDGFFPAYHMNKDKWISIALDRPELDHEIKNLVDMSYQIVKGKHS